MGQALYRKYRSKSLDEIVGQEHITTTLQHALQAGRISHAYLFTGPRGVGKTSIARILAHAINDIPYTDDSAQLDIIEIDAASNRRIDEIRDLRDKVNIAPAMAKYKVYIIDEVHMLTKEAFNALLKTLEEPPAHVVFILATTEVHKLPATIVSRTQRYVFRPVEQAKVVAHLKVIAKQEKLKISDEALALIAQHGEGSFRDSISLLDQAGNYGQAVDLAMIQDMLGVAPETALQAIIQAVASGDKLAVINGLTALTERGYPASQLAAQLGQLLRHSLLTATPVLPEAQLLQLLGNLIEVPASVGPDQALEIVLLTASLATTPIASAPVATPVEPTPIIPTKPPKATPVTPPAAQTTTPTGRKPASQPLAEPASSPSTATEPFDLADWPAVLEMIKQKHNTLYSILKIAQPTLDDGQLQLCVQFPFHQRRLNEAKNRQIIGDVIKSVAQREAAFHCVVGPKLANPVETSAAASTDSLSTVSNIFGGGEVLS